MKEIHWLRVCAQGAGISWNFSGYREANDRFFCLFYGLIILVWFLFMVYPLPSWFSTGKSHFWLSPSNLIEPFRQSQVYQWMQYSRWFSKAASPLSPNQQAHLAGTKAHPKYHCTLSIPADSHNWHQSFSKVAPCLARPNRHPQSAQASPQSNSYPGVWPCIGLLTSYTENKPRTPAFP